MMLSLLLRRIIRRWKYYVMIITPLALLPLPVGIGTKEAKCAFAVLVVTIFWMCEVVPLAVTSLLPVVLFPLLGILTTDEVCKNYMKETNMMLLAGIMAAIAIENCNLHRRIALRVLLWVGGTVKWLMVGFMGTTAFLSMWISNTATTAMMLPIVDSIINELFAENKAKKRESEIYSINNGHEEFRMGKSTEILTEIISEKGKENSDSSNEKTAEQKDRMKRCILLSVAYAANLGGTGTITGTGTNLVLMENLSSYFGNKTGINFATWMLFNIPSMIIMLILAWVWLQIAILGPRQMFRKENKDDVARVKALIRNQYFEMGRITFHECLIMTLFIILVLLWAFRSPEFIPGWADVFPAKGIKDSVAGMLIVFLMFALPSRLDLFCGHFADESLDYPPPRALTWTGVQNKIPWSVILLMGGGFALANGSSASGLSKWLGGQLTGLKSLPSIGIMSVISIMTAMLTEVASNTATATILLPVLIDMSRAICVHPIYLMLPATIACSYAFMLPIATPPNAIVFEASKMKTLQMVKPGIVMNILCVATLILMVNTLGMHMFQLNSYPEWAVTNSSSCNATTS